MNDMKLQSPLPFGLEKVGKLTVTLPEAQKETAQDGFDKVFVSADKDNYVLYGKDAQFKDARVGQPIEFLDESGTSQHGTIKGIQDQDNTFAQGFSRTVSSAFGKVAMLASPVAGGVIQVARMSSIKAAAANAAERAITPGTLRSIFDTFVRQPTHYPSAAEIAKARNAAIAGVKPSTVILTGIAVGAAIGLSIPVYNGFKASKNKPDETKIKDVTGKTTLQEKIQRAVDKGENIEDVVKNNKGDGNQPQIIIINQQKTVVVKEKAAKPDKTLEHLETAGEVAKGVGKVGVGIVKLLTHDSN